VPPRLSHLAQKLGRLGIAFVVLLIVYLPLYFLAPGRGFTALAALAVYATGGLFALQLFRRNVRRVIWRLRNRLIVAYLFIAFVPIVLIGILVAIGGYSLVGQLAVYLVSSELDRRTTALDGIARLVAATPAAKRENTVREIAPYIRDTFPDVELLIHDKDVHRYPLDSDLSPPPPAWKDANGKILKAGMPCSWAHAIQGDTEVTLLAPLTPDLLARLVPGIGEVVFLGSSDFRWKRSTPASALQASKNRRARQLAPPSNRFDVDVAWIMPVYFSYWETPEKQREVDLVVHTRPSIVLGKMFSQVNWAQVVLAGLLLVAGLLLLVWVISFIVGVSLTRTITGAVHNLYEGTEHVKSGDFSHRIAVEGHDQLAELGRSFNGMTENLERLIIVEKEQERLKSEIAIAREVQSQLFPRGAPAMKTLELTGVCHPARMVSGDYYDFVRVQESNVALAIGDVAGKGISAALLMAAIQSIMRTQLTAGVPAHAAAVHGGNGGVRVALSTADLVSQLNRQVYATTAPEKFATFFFGLYNDGTRELTYTNAGHLPPILMRDGKAEQLEVTGTVVGAFPSAHYEERTVQLRQGDLLVAFTDGIVEPENEYGVPFGEEKLIELLLRYTQRESKEIIARVMETVEQWMGSAELPDDMTMLVARSV
jgi:sigma-B regulation protein RsbU (phosphoserine phosphatase)